MINTSDFQKAIDLINNSGNILIATHTKPDGDACGCVAALAYTLQKLNKNVKQLLLSALPWWYEFLFETRPEILSVDSVEEQLKNIKTFNPDLIILADVNSDNQLPRFSDILKQNHCKVLVIDHHITNDGLGDIELIDTTASAAGVIVYDLLNRADWPVTPKIAQALFVAVATDTGWFHFANTDSRTFKIAADLIAKGAQPAELYCHLYQNFTPSRFKLMAAMLNSLQLDLDGRYATQQLLKEAFKNAQASYEDTENLIDECQRINSIQAAALFVQLADGRIKCSLRSRGAVDVREIAQKFGGGGHKMAAGATFDTNLTDAKKLIFDQIAEQFNLLK